MKTVLLLLPAFLLAGFFLEAAPRRYDDDLWIYMKEIRDSMDDLRREVNNHESEIRTMAEKSLTQEDRIEHMQKELKEAHQAQKEQLKNNSGTLDMKIGTLESANKGVIADLKQIKGHSNETQELLKLYRDKINELEKSVGTLTHNLEMMQSAMNNLMDVVKAGAGISSVEGGLKVYRVKAGDTLEKIARAHKTTIRALKEINGLTKDQIGIGQTLKIPE